MQQLLDKLLDVSPRKVLKRLRLAADRVAGDHLVHSEHGAKCALQRIHPEDGARRAVQHALHRRCEGGQLQRLLPEFFVERDGCVGRLLQEVFDNGKIPPNFFLRGELANYDERVVEYPVALECLLHAAAEGPVDVLDVGCVLNNALMREYVVRVGRMMWFLNPSLEPLQYEQNVAFLLADMRGHQLPGGLEFPLVTCLSTLEHIGMDNTRYGGEPKEFVEPPEHPELFAIEGTRSIARLVAPGGMLLISVPYGVFEYVHMYRHPGDPIYYSFNAEMLRALEQSLTGFEVGHSIYKVAPNRGWIETDIEDRAFLKYADDCAAAGAVAFIKARRPG